MIKAFTLTLTFWTLYIIVDSVMDAILFYKAFPWYKNSKRWHRIKYLRIGFAVATGWFAHSLFLEISGYDYSVFGFLLLWFLLLRYVLFEKLMERWSGV